MRGVIPEIRARGAELAFVGNGNGLQARAFREEQGLDGPILVDPGLKAYQAAGLKRGLMTLLDPRVVGRGLRAFRAGFRQTEVQGDPWQQGGAFVFGRGGEVRYVFVSDAAGHHPPPEELLAALP